MINLYVTQFQENLQSTVLKFTIQKLLTTCSFNHFSLLILLTGKTRVQGRNDILLSQHIFLTKGEKANNMSKHLECS